MYCNIAPNPESAPNADQIVQWILEHPDQCPPLPTGPYMTRANVNDFDADSDSDSGSSDTVEGSSVNDIPVIFLEYSVTKLF